MKDLLIEKVKEYTNKDSEKLHNIVNACNNYNGSLEDYYYYNHDEEFYDIMFDTKNEVARAIYYADDYNYCDEYIKLNVYGNCETIHGYKYNKLLIDNEDEIVNTFVEELLDNYNYFINEIYDDDIKKEINGILENSEENYN